MRLDDQQIEKAARLLCQKIGVNPDEQTEIPCPDKKPGCLLAHYGPMWQVYKGFVVNHLLIEECILEVKL
jgi:hypothetical protein